MDLGDGGGVVGEVERLLDGGVATADDGDALAAEEEAVAGGAGGDAGALEALFRFEAEPAGLGAGGDDHRARDVEVARVAGAAERSAAEIDAGDQVVDQAGADMLGLGGHLFHQPGALDGGGEAGVILDVGGDHQLAAGLQAGHQHRREAGAGGVDGRRVAGGAGADDQDGNMMRVRHGRRSGYDVA